MKRVYVVLTVALLVLLCAVPVGAQEHGPAITGLVPTGCEAECVDLITDGSPITGCSCWAISWCTPDWSEVDFAEVQIIADWYQGLHVNVSSNGVPLPTRSVDPSFIYSGGAANYHFTNLGQGNCLNFIAGTTSGWGDPMIYEMDAFGPPASGRPSPLSAPFWMVRQQISKVISAPIVANFIYVILALIFGGMGLKMIIRGLFGSTGVGDFHHGSGMTHRGSGLAHKGSGLTHPREVGDVD